MMNDDPLDDEIDFSKGVRGKFYRPDAVLHVPVYLNQELQTYLLAAAERKGITLSELVNELLSKEIEIVESMK